MTKTEAKRQATAEANRIVEQEMRTLLKEAQRKVLAEGFWRHAKRVIGAALVEFRGRE
jgi:hypothetical protein